MKANELILTFKSAGNEPTRHVAVQCACVHDEYRIFFVHMCPDFFFTPFFFFSHVPVCMSIGFF